MIDFDSPLRRLPPGLSPEQSITLDGIRHAAEVATLAYRRLTQALTQIAIDPPEPATEQSADAMTAVYLDAWAIIDAVDRLRMLVKLLPMDEATRASHDELDKALQDVRSARNVSDHLAQRISYVVAKGLPAFGALGWFTLTREYGGFSCALIPGTFFEKLSASLVNPAGKPFRPPTDMVTMFVGEHRVSLSEAMATGKTMVAGVEAGISQAVHAHGLEGKHMGADMTFRVEMEFHAD